MVLFLIFLIFLIFLTFQHSVTESIFTYEDLNFITFVPLYVFYPKDSGVFEDNQHIAFNESMVMVFSNFFSSIAMICLLLSEFSFKDHHKNKKLENSEILWSRSLNNKDVSNEFLLFKFIKFNVLKSVDLLKNFIILIKFFIKKNTLKIIHNYSQLKFIIIIYFKKFTSKNLLWRPLFKRTSYFGLYSSSKLKWKKLK